MNEAPQGVAPEISDLEAGEIDGRYPDPAPEPFCVCGHGKSCHFGGTVCQLRNCDCLHFRQSAIPFRTAQRAQGEGKCSKCGHAIHLAGRCLNMASDSDCNCDHGTEGEVLFSLPAQAISAEARSAIMAVTFARAAFDGDPPPASFLTLVQKESEAALTAHAAAEVARVEGEIKAKLDYVHSMGLRFGMMKSSDKPEPYLMHTWTENSDHQRMFREWTESLSQKVQLAQLCEALAQKKGEVSRLLADKTRAENTLLDAGYTYKEGAIAWKPPVNHENGRLSTPPTERAGMSERFLNQVENELLEARWELCTLRARIAALEQELAELRDCANEICSHLRRKDKSLPTLPEVRDWMAKYRAENDRLRKALEDLLAVDEFDARVRGASVRREPVMQAARDALASAEKGEA